MSFPVDQCKEYLEKRYRSLLEGFNVFSNKENFEAFPSCYFVDSLLRIVENEDPSENGIVISDPEVGICLYILPYTSKSTDINEQIAAALRIRSRLLPESINYGNDNKQESVDQFGSWRVILHWLVEKNEYQSWLKKIINIRRNTAHFEEIPVDAICNEEADWAASIRKHGLPRLLLDCRSIFKKNSLQEIESWSSANDQVRQELTGFAHRFSDQNTKILAELLEKSVIDFDKRTSIKNAIQKAPSHLNKVKIRNFRNISKLEIGFGDDPVKSVIIHGPNGTGKSAISEAISLGLCGTSYRYNDFLHDGDTKQSSESYSQSYIQPIRSSSGDWEISINEEISAKRLLEDSDLSDQALKNINGNILSQETSQDFLGMSSEDLGAYILQGYSDLAEHVENVFFQYEEEANRRRKDILQQYSINTNISRIDTAKERVAEAVLRKELPNLSSQLMMWTNSSGDVALANSMKGVQDKDHLRDGVCGRAGLEEIKNSITYWLRAYNNFIQSTSERYENIKEISGKSDFLNEKIKIWHNWLISKKDGAVVADTKEVIELKKQLNDLDEQRKNIIEKGQEYRGRLEHLTQVSGFVLNIWHQDHSETCPTCDTDLSSRNGIAEVIKKITAETTELREIAKNDYQTVTVKIVEIQKKLAATGLAEHPISQEEQDGIVEILQPILSGKGVMEEYLKNIDQTQALLAQIGVLKQNPGSPAKIDNVEEMASRVAGILNSEFTRLSVALDEPERWKKIGKELNNLLSAIVDRHLPETLGRLWKEMVLNLTAAPWLLPSKPDFSVRAHRGSKKVSVVLEDLRLARYILNKAEVHILGLAWFFSNYISSGRFKHSIICMDDPAQEMDQATYRDLCRLWETLIRLHKYNRRPLTLVALLNQEDRALDAARATSGALNVLNWGGRFVENDDQSVEKIMVLGAKSYFRMPNTNKIKSAG